MANVINATSTGNGGLVSTGDDSGILNIQTNETTAITIDASQIVSYTNNLGTVAGYPAYQCRAWVNFNGTGTVAIRASGNVSSITDDGVGRYTVNFSNSMPDTNYAVFTGFQTPAWDTTTHAYSYATGSVKVEAGTGTSPTYVDVALFTVSVFR